MDRPGFSSPPFDDKKIVLSPPAVESKQYSFLQGAGNGQAPPVGFHSERQQSVGYNLQHEFETLTADLDLDLRNNKDMQPSGATPMQSSNVGQGLMSSALQYGFGDLSTGSLQSTMLKDAALSPDLPTTSSHSALGSLLNNNGNNSFLPPLASIPNRPQSVNDFSNFFNRQQRQQQAIDRQQQQQATNFYLDLIVFCNWIETLNPRDNITMIDYLCNNLPLDILLTFKSKLDGHLTHYHSLQTATQPAHLQQNQPVSFGILSPSYQLQQNDLLAEMDNLNLDASMTNDSSSASTQKGAPTLQQPKPKLNSVRGHNPHLYAEQQTQRPRSADPNIHNKYNANYQQQQQFERARSPTSHLYEKTNFLQLAAATSNSPSISQQKGASNSDESVDLSTHAALKLGALATINSRVALDSNRKGHVQGAHGHQQPHSHYFPQQGTQQQSPFMSPAVYEESINRTANSSSVPILAQHNKSPPGLSKTKKSSDGLGQGANTSSGTPQTTSTTSMPADISNPDLLNNIPAWLKLLRLHKYTDCLKDIYWKDLIKYDDPMLEKRGVKALGARRKLLKAFDAVKESL